MCTTCATGKHTEPKSLVKAYKDAYGFPILPVWTHPDLKWLHLLACRLTNMGHACVIRPIHNRFCLLVSQPVGFVDKFEYYFKYCTIENILDNHGKQWDAFWSQVAVTEQEQAWAETLPLYSNK